MSLQEDYRYYQVDPLSQLQLNNKYIWMDSIELVEKLTSRLAKTFADIQAIVQSEIKRVSEKQSHTNDNIIPQTNPINNQSIHKQQPPIPINIKNPSAEDSPKEISREKKQSQKSKSATKPRTSRRAIQSEKPKKPLNALKIFIKELQESYSKMDNISEQEITQMAGKKWEQMSEDKKDPYVQAEKEQKQRYEAELQRFYERNPEEQQKQLDKQAKKLKKQEQKQKQKSEKKNKKQEEGNKKGKSASKTKLPTQKQVPSLKQFHEEVDQYLDLGEPEKPKLFSFLKQDQLGQNMQQQNMDSDSLGAELA